MFIWSCFTKQGIRSRGVPTREARQSQVQRDRLTNIAVPSVAVEDGSNRVGSDVERNHPRVLAVAVTEVPSLLDSGQVGVGGNDVVADFLVFAVEHLERLETKLRSFPTAVINTTKQTEAQVWVALRPLDVNVPRFHIPGLGERMSGIDVHCVLCTVDMRAITNLGVDV